MEEGKEGGTSHGKQSEGERKGNAFHMVPFAANRKVSQTY